MFLLAFGLLAFGSIGFWSIGFWSIGFLALVLVVLSVEFLECWFSNRFVLTADLYDSIKIKSKKNITKHKKFSWKYKT